MRPVLQTLALARIVAIGLRREEMRAERFVERIDDIGNFEILGFADRAGEIGPEFAQHFFPVDAAARNIVELSFEIGGEIIFDIIAEIIFKECRDDAPAIFGYEAFFIEHAHNHGPAAPA